MIAFGKPTESVFGTGASPFALFFQGDTSTVLYEKSRFDAVAFAAAEKFSSRETFDIHYSTWLHTAKQLDAFSWDVYQGKYAGYARYWKTFVEFWAESVFIDCFDAGVDFAEMNRIAQEHDLNRTDIQILTTPIEPSYVQKFGLDASKSALGQTEPADFLRQFFWYPTNYVEFGGLDENQMTKIIDSHREKAQRTLALFQESHASLAARQQAVLDDKGLEQNPLWLYQAMMAWRDTRKRFNFAGLYGFDRMAREALEENGVPAELFTGLWPTELLDGERGIPSEKQLCQRIEHGTLALMEPNTYELVVGPLAHRLFSKMEQKPQSATLELRGQSACLGRVQAPVRIVQSPADFFRQGEILVTTMTRPEFVPLMKKAAGILTDEGGITSHAAVVSRELNVPCIVGTQDATHRLKTGDVVDLDAFHGLVRKVSYQSPSQI
ncbi:hypothetical protein HY994_05070 [Candidatus Micrarchaeota archaeon]|nr:hypothetical protein [Candidatus Micrarchaeota archaeon]